MITLSTFQTTFPNLPDNATVIKSVNNPPALPSNNNTIDWAKKGTVYNLPAISGLELERRIITDERGEPVAICVCRVSLDKEYILYCEAS
jgi:hypothetical protein